MMQFRNNEKLNLCVIISITDVKMILSSNQ